MQVWNVDLRGDRSLTLRHTTFRRRPLGDGTDEVMRPLARLWGFTVRLERAGDDGKIELLHEIRGETNRPRAPA